MTDLNLEAAEREKEIQRLTGYGQEQLDREFLDKEWERAELVREVRQEFETLIPACLAPFLAVYGRENVNLYVPGEYTPIGVKRNRNAPSGAKFIIWRARGVGERAALGGDGLSTHETPSIEIALAMAHKEYHKLQELKALPAPVDWLELAKGMVDPDQVQDAIAAALIGILEHLRERE